MWQGAVLDNHMSKKDLSVILFEGTEKANGASKRV